MHFGDRETSERVRREKVVWAQIKVIRQKLGAVRLAIRLTQDLRQERRLTRWWKQLLAERRALYQARGNLLGSLAKRRPNPAPQQAKTPDEDFA